MPCMVPVGRMASLCNPLRDWPWDCRAPSRQELARLLEVAPLEPQPIEAESTPTRHAGRIRYLCLHGWDDAIEVDVGVPALGYTGPSWPVLDGNHRLAAALVRGDPQILVDVAGQLDFASELLGVPESRLRNGHF